MPSISGSLCPTDPAFTTDLGKSQLFVLWGFSPPNCYKHLYFFLVALYAIPELYKSSFPIIFTLVCIWDFLLFPGTKLQFPGHFDLSHFLPFTSLPSGQVLLLGLFIYFARKVPPAHFTTLPDYFLTFLSSQTPGQFLFLAVTAAQASTVKLEKKMQPCSS